MGIASTGSYACCCRGLGDAARKRSVDSARGFRVLVVAFFGGLKGVKKWSLLVDTFSQPQFWMR